MIELSDAFVKQFIKEIDELEEKNRRKLAKRRHDIYKDGGKEFLLDAVRKEFGADAIDEMRLAPINLLKKIVNKRSAVYKKPPVRKCESPVDQALVDYYTAELKINDLMQKVNRYYTLFSNTVIYTRPMGDRLTSTIVPSYLYSVAANPFHLTEHEAYCFNAFDDEIQPTSEGEKQAQKDARRYIFWSDKEHFTTDGNGARMLLDETAGPEQFVNPIEIKPIVNVAKDRDNEVWATQGEDMVDLTIAIQLGWTDVLTIAKHQGFSILTVISEEEPKKLTIGVNRAVWLKQREGGPTPSISYVQGQSPLAEYKDLLMDLLGLLLTTNDMDPGSIGGKGSTRNFTSGFHALIAMSDNLEAVEMDKPAMLDAERAHWEIIKRWHNWMFDIGALNPEAKALGKFSEELSVAIQFADIKPLESEQEMIANVKELKALGLITKADALKKLHPDMSDDQVEEMLQKIEEELTGLREAMAKTLEPKAEKAEGPSLDEMMAEADSRMEKEG